MESAREKAKEEYTALKAEGVTASRDAMLAAIQNSQPPFVKLPSPPHFAPYFEDVVQQYISVLTGIGGRAFLVNSIPEILAQIADDFAGVRKIASFEEAFDSIANVKDSHLDPHLFEEVDVCIFTSPLAVAENGAVWVSNWEMPVRVLPFITQSLVAIIHKKDIVATMHDAYDIIADKDYDFATFIAGPSKTADIEQSLVLGAHGPKTMTVFILAG